MREPLSFSYIPVLLRTMKKKSVIATAIIIVLLAVMAITRPSEKTHEKAIAKAVSANFDNVTAGFIHPNEKILTLALTPLIDVDDYFFVSIGRCPLIDRVVSVGLFGHIFTMSDDMLAQAIQEQIDKIPLPETIKEGLNGLLPWN